MPQYEVGKRWFIPQLGRKPDPGEIVELDEGVAEYLMHNEPGLLKPVRRTTQARPEAVRQTEPKKKRSRARK